MNPILGSAGRGNVASVVDGAVRVAPPRKKKAGSAAVASVVVEGEDSSVPEDRMRRRSITPTQEYFEQLRDFSTTDSPLSSVPGGEEIRKQTDPQAPPRRSRGSAAAADAGIPVAVGGPANLPDEPAAPPRRRRVDPSNSTSSGTRHSSTLESIHSQDPARLTGNESPAEDLRASTPTDQEILDSVLLTCLDTGESVPLSQAEKLLPEGLNPISLTVIKRTGEFNAESEPLAGDDDGADGGSSKGMFKKVLKTAKTKATAAASAAGKVGGEIAAMVGEGIDTLRGDDEQAREEQERAEEAAGFVRMRTKSTKSNGDDLKHLRPVQTLSGNDDEIKGGAIWTMKTSNCGRLLATAGQCKTVRVWVTSESYDFFNKIRATENAGKDTVPSSPRHSSLTSARGSDKDVYRSIPFCEYEGHTADVLDLSWSNSQNYFLLSSSMDKTVRLWHVSRGECLACFEHEDFVTAIAFHPRNDKFFLSGSLDCKLRLWNIPEKK